MRACSSHNLVVITYASKFRHDCLIGAINMPRPVGDRSTIRSRCFQYNENVLPLVSEPLEPTQKLMSNTLNPKRILPPGSHRRRDHRTMCIQYHIRPDIHLRIQTIRHIHHPDNNHAKQLPRRRNRNLRLGNHRRLSSNLIYNR